MSHICPTMNMTSPVSCVSNCFSFYWIVCFLIFCIWCHQMNQIHLMMSMTMMCLTPDPLVCTLFALFLCVLKIPLVVLVVWVLNFCKNRSQVQMWCFEFFCVCSNRSQFQRWSNHRKKLALKFIVFSPNLKLSFIVIVVVWLCLTHSYRCSFIKNIIWRSNGHHP